MQVPSWKFSTTWGEGQKGEAKGEASERRDAKEGSGEGKARRAVEGGGGKVDLGGGWLISGLSNPLLTARSWPSIRPLTQQFAIFSPQPSGKATPGEQQTSSEIQAPHPRLQMLLRSSCLQVLMGLGEVSRREEGQTQEGEWPGGKVAGAGAEGLSGCLLLLKWTHQ
jgi:hypothetical protein